MKNEVAIAIGAVPATMFVLANVGGSTAQIAGTRDPAIRQSLVITAVALMLAAAATGSTATVVTTGLSVGAVFYAMRDIWNTPTLADVVS
jgi:hypothetical protein